MEGRLMLFMPKYNHKSHTWRPAYSTGTKLYFLDNSNPIRDYGLYRNCEVKTDRDGYAFITGEYIDTEVITSTDVHTFLKSLNCIAADYYFGKIVVGKKIRAYLALCEVNGHHYIIFKYNGRLGALDYSEDLLKDYNTTYTTLSEHLQDKTDMIHYHNTKIIDFQCLA